MQEVRKCCIDLGIDKRSPRADFGELGEFDLKKAPGAEELHDAVRDRRTYYNLWKEAGELSLAWPDDAASSDEESMEERVDLD